MNSALFPKNIAFANLFDASDLLSCFSILCLSSTLSIYTSKKFVFIIFPNWGHNRKRKLLYGRSHLSSKSSKILNVKNPRFLHSI